MNSKIKSCLIIENEPNFSESLGSKLEDLNYNAKILYSIEKVMELEEKFDLVLVSLNFKDEPYFFDMIKGFQDSILIMMTPHIDYSCFSKAINIGANDYILKPFKIESLIQKVNIFQEKKDFEIREKRLEKFITTILQEDKNLKFDLDFKLPLIIYSNLERNVDFYVFSYSKYLNMDFEIISFENLVKYHQNIDKNLILYLRDYPKLIKKDRVTALNIAKNMNIILYSHIDEKINGFDYLKIEMGNEKLNFDRIFTVTDYIKKVIIQHQDVLPDTELSKSLGISRKSLWEKRRKFDMQKPKKNKKDLQ